MDIATSNTSNFISHGIIYQVNSSNNFKIYSDISRTQILYIILFLHSLNGDLFKSHVKMRTGGYKLNTRTYVKSSWTNPYTTCMHQRGLHHALTTKQDDTAHKISYVARWPIRMCPEFVRLIGRDLGCVTIVGRGGAAPLRLQ